MGDYADDQFRREVMSRHGFDPGSMYRDTDRREIRCRNCSRMFRTQQAADDHMRDKHTKPKEQNT